MNKSTKVLLILLITLSAGIILLAQNKPDEFKDKLKKLKDAEKITISTPDGDITFEGDEAKKLAKTISRHGKRIFINSADKDFHGFDFVFDDDMIKHWSRSGNTSVVSVKPGSNYLVTLSDEDRELEISKDDGETYVKDVKGSGSDVEVIELTGEEADEYIEKLKEEGVIKELGTGKELIQTFSITEDDDYTNVDINIDEENGEKTITVKKKDKDGNETEEVFTGDEADEFFKKYTAGKAMSFLSNDDDKNISIFFDIQGDDVFDDSINVNLKRIMKNKVKVHISDED